MNRKWGLLICCLLIIGTLVGCNQDKENKIDVSEEKTSGKETSQQDKKDKKVKQLSLPSQIPSDFPLPDGMVITEVEDDSDEKKYAYGVRFTFNPELDLESLFKEYDEYAKKLEYTILLDGEGNTTEDSYQFAATAKFSASDSFIVTLKLQNPMFGDIQYKESK